VLRLAIDENLDNDILRGLRRRIPGLDATRVQDAGLSGEDDATVLAWAAAEGRVLLTHDVSTMTSFARERIERCLPMPGVFQVPTSLSIGLAIDDLVLIVECSLEDEWTHQVRHLPL